MSKLTTIRATVHEGWDKDLTPHWSVRFSAIGGRYVWSEPMWDEDAAKQLASIFNAGVDAE